LGLIMLLVREFSTNHPMNQHLNYQVESRLFQ
jgi:hypothetical protein